MGRDLRPMAPSGGRGARGRPAPDGWVPSTWSAASRSATSSSWVVKCQGLGLTVLDENGKTQIVTMGSYGIGVTASWRPWLRRTATTRA